MDADYRNWVLFSPRWRRAQLLMDDELTEADGAKVPFSICEYSFNGYGRIVYLPMSVALGADLVAHDDCF